MRRVFTTVAVAAVALALVGCGTNKPVGESVGEPYAILTGELGCFAGGEGGIADTLLPDPLRGVKFAGLPVMWPTGYTARRIDGQITIFDAQGDMKAITGRKYYISVALPPDPRYSAYAAAAECGYHWDFIDCTANPTDSYCPPR